MMNYDHDKGWVGLAYVEMQFALLVGGYRRISSLMNPNRHDRFKRYERAEAWNVDINGSLAEFGASKWFKVYWDGAQPNQINLPDVGPLEVRAKCKDNERLVITRGDLEKKGPESIFISVYVQIPGLHLCGWLRAREAPKLGEDIREKDNPFEPRWFVENRYLHRMRDLEWLAHDPFAGIKKGPPLRVAASENPHPTQAKFTQVSPIRSRA